jgi:hypothetical protein
MNNKFTPGDDASTNRPVKRLSLWNNLIERAISDTRHSSFSDLPSRICQLVHFSLRHAVNAKRTAAKEVQKEDKKKKTEQSSMTGFAPTKLPLTNVPY